jgi:hypothetical protein
MSSSVVVRIIVDTTVGGSACKWNGSNEAAGAIDVVVVVDMAVSWCVPFGKLFEVVAVGVAVAVVVGVNRSPSPFVFVVSRFFQCDDDDDLDDKDDDNN